MKDEQVGISKGDLSDLLRTVITETRKPIVDEAAVAAKERHRQRLRDQQAENDAKQAAKERACSHLREDGTCRIAWHKNSDGVWRGVCQLCQGWFEPGKPDYARMLKIPTRSASVVG